MENSLTVSAGPKKNLWLSLRDTSFYCLGISVLLGLTGLASPLWAGAVVSFAIGWSISLSNRFLEGWLSTVLPAMLAPLPSTALGIVIGLLISGGLIFGQPGYFFGDDSKSIFFGVFFGITGIVLVGSRGRLAQAETALAQVEVQRQRQEKLLLETELKLLQAQIEPHFLFNTLSNIISLLRSDVDAAERALLNLSTLLRSSLQRTRNASVTLSQELTIVQAYLEIQAIRMGERLHYHIEPENPDADAQLANWDLPPLLVQPLVENAIKHGIEPLQAGGEVEITAAIEADELLIVVSDTGQGLAAEAGSDTSGGTGLTNVHARLQALYGSEASMTIEEIADAGLRVSLRIPRAVP